MLKKEQDKNLVKLNDMKLKSEEALKELKKAEANLVKNINILDGIIKSLNAVPLPILVGADKK